MDYNMERWYMAVGQRFSMRRYSGEPSAEDLASLEKTAEMLSIRGVRIAIGFSDKVFSPMFLGMGKVGGTRCFAAFFSKDAEPYSVGYLGEAFVLESTALGLGTCWLGASFRRDQAEKALAPLPGETLVCITPLGQPGEPFTTRPRKPLNRLTGLTREQLTMLPEWQLRALECARRAPSAVNGQPWEFQVGKEVITIRCTGSNFGYGPLDNGIAMLHLELGAAHTGVIGSYETGVGFARFVPTAYGK